MGFREDGEKQPRAGRAQLCRPVKISESFSEGYGREKSRLWKGKTGGPGLHPVTCRLITSAHFILPQLSYQYDPPGQGEKSRRRLFNYFRYVKLAKNKSRLPFRYLTHFPQGGECPLILPAAGPYGHRALSRV